MFSLRSAVELIHSLVCAQYINEQCEESMHRTRISYCLPTYGHRRDFSYISPTHTYTGTHACFPDHYSITGLRKFPINRHTKSLCFINAHLCINVCVCVCVCLFLSVSVYPFSFIHRFSNHKSLQPKKRCRVCVCICVDW